MSDPQLDKSPLPQSETLPVLSADFARQVAFFDENSIARHLLDALPDVVFVLNAHRQIIFANRTLLNLLDVCDETTLLGRKPGDVMECRSAVHAEWGCGTGEACTTCGALAAILSGQNGQEDVKECLLTRQVNGDTVNMTLRIWAVPLPFPSEEFTMMIGTDISHERRRLALERTFFHDILNLIGSIRGFAELMELDESADPAEICRKIHRASQRVIDEIDAQRMLLAAEKGELQVNQQLLNTQIVLEDLKSLYEDLAGRKTLSLVDSVAPLSFVSDKVIIGRILGNMVKNALEASALDEAVTMGDALSDGRICFWVHNQTEIPKSHQPRIFQRDFSTKGLGRGLGTYSMKLLSELLGAEVTFESDPEQGTTFRLLIPLN